MTQSLSISTRSDGCLDITLPPRCDLRVAHQIYDALKTHTKGNVEIGFPAQIAFFSAALGEILLRVSQSARDRGFALCARGGQTCHDALARLGIQACTVFSTIDDQPADAGSGAPQTHLEAV